MKMREVVDLALRRCFLWRSNAPSSSPSILCAGGGPILSLAGNPDSEYAVMVKYLYVSIGYHVHRSIVNAQSSLIVSLEIMQYSTNLQQY